MIEACRRAAALLVLLCGLAVTTTAAAQQPVQVHWDLPSRSGSSCVELQRVRREVQRLLGRELFVPPGEADVLLEVRPRPQPPSAQVLLRDRDGYRLGRRTLRTQSCDELADALTLTLSLMLDFTVDEVRSKREQQQQGGAPAGEPSAAPAEAERARERSAERRDVPRFGVWFDAGMAWGFAPTAAPHVWLGPSLRWSPAVDLELGAGYRAALPFERRGARLVARRWEMRVALCHELAETGAVRWRACATMQPGWLRARAEGWPDARTARAFSLHAGGELSGAWQTTPATRLRLSAGLLGAPRGYRFTARRSATDRRPVGLWTIPPLQLQLGIGFVWGAPASAPRLATGPQRRENRGGSAGVSAPSRGSIILTGSRP